MYSSFSTFTLLCSHYCLVSEHFHHPPKKPVPIKQSLFSLPLPRPWQSLILLSLRICVFCVRVNGIVQTSVSGFFHFECGLACVSTSFLFMAGEYPLYGYMYIYVCIHWRHIHTYIHPIHRNLFMHSSVDEHLSSFHPLAIVNSAATNRHVHIFVGTLIFSSLIYIVILYLTYWGNHQSVFHGEYAVLISSAMYKGSPFSPSWPTLFFSIIVIQLGVKYISLWFWFAFCK